MSLTKLPPRPGRITRLGEYYQLRFERPLIAARPRVWDAITSSTELGRWFPAEAQWDFVVGGRIQFEFPPDASTDGGSCPPGMITAIDRPHTFAFLWGTELLRFELLEQAAGTLLVFTHTINVEDKPDAARFAAGWQVCFEVLDHYLSDAKPPPTDRWETAYAQYTADFAGAEQ